MLKKIFSSTLVYGIAPQVPKLLMILILPFITRYLTDFDFGVYGMILAYTGVLNILSNLGLRIVLINAFFKNKEQLSTIWSEIYGLLIIWSFFYGILLSVILFFIIPVEASNLKWQIILLNVLPVVLFSVSNMLGTTYYQINKQPFPVGIRTAVFGSIGVLVTYYSIAILKLGFMGWFWSIAIVTVLTNISYLISMMFFIKIRPTYIFKWKNIKRYLIVSLPTVPHNFSGYLLDSSDKVVMDFTNVSTSNLGKYNAAYMVGNIVQQIGIAAGLAISPFLMEAYKKNENVSARRIILLLQSVFFIITFNLSIWSKELFSILIKNETLALMYPLSIVIIMSYNYRPMYLGAISKFFYEERTAIIWRLTFVSGLINVFLNFILIPFVGFEVAAYTTFVSLMIMGYTGFFMRTYKEINDIDYKPLRWLLFTVILTIFAYFSVEYQWKLKVILSILSLSIATLFVFKTRLWKV